MHTYQQYISTVFTAFIITLWKKLKKRRNDKKLLATHTTFRCCLIVVWHKLTTEELFIWKVFHNFFLSVLLWLNNCSKIAFSTSTWIEYYVFYISTKSNKRIVCFTRIRLVFVHLISLIYAFQFQSLMMQHCLFDCQSFDLLRFPYDSIGVSLCCYL